MKIAMVAGEISGDKLGAGLIRALQDQQDDCEFIGIAGTQMIEAGCQSLYPIERLSIMGLVEILRHYRQLYLMRAELVQTLVDAQIDVFIGIDAPAFNIGLAALLKRHGITTVQYVCPQVWAWREGRIGKIRAALDLILAILPFEQDYLQRHQIAARYVGHSMADEIPNHLAKAPARVCLQIPEDKTVIALMPGSREKEWQYHVELFLQTAAQCYSQRPDIHFIGVMANQQATDFFNEQLKQLDQQLPISLVERDSLMAISAADVVLAVSGTAALEIFLAKRPMVIAYKTSWMTYQIARRLVKTRYISLPNILADQAIVPEFVQQQATVESLTQSLFDWLDRPEAVQTLEKEAERIHQQLRCGASEQAAKAVLELCQPV